MVRIEKISSENYLQYVAVVNRTRWGNLLLPDMYEDNVLDDDDIEELDLNKEKDDLLKNSIISYSPIIDKLKESGIDPSTIKYITSLKTERLEVRLESCLLVIDKNYFRNKVDFNLEVESDTKSRANSQLKEIIKPFGLSIKKDYINKAKRAIYNL